MKKTKVAKAVVTAAAGLSMAVMVGQIMPVNLQYDARDYTVVAASDFSASAAQAACCGPYAQQCPEFKCVWPN